MNRRHRGFTLIEVLVALAILAISAAALVHQAQQSARVQQQMELRSIALVLADSEMAMVASEAAWPPLGKRSRKVEMEAMEWELEAEVQATSRADLRRLDVRVRPAQQAEGHTVVLTTYMGRY